MTIPIIPVLEEAFLLWMRKLGFFILLACFLEFPSIALGHYHRRDDPTVWNVARNAGEVVLQVIFQAIGVAAVLSSFAHRSAEKTWLVMVRGVERYTGTLVGVQLFLCVIVFLMVIPVGLIYFMLHALFGLDPLWILFGELIFLIFLKYALANPLVVAEHLDAGSALSVSWRMTRNRFVFVFGCYLIVGVVEWAINYLARLLDTQAWISPATTFLSHFMGTYWFVLSWVMYVRIKAADEPQSQYVGGTKIQ